MHGSVQSNSLTQFVNLHGAAISEMPRSSQSYGALLLLRSDFHQGIELWQCPNGLRHDQ